MSDEPAAEDVRAELVALRRSLHRLEQQAGVTPRAWPVAGFGLVNPGEIIAADHMNRATGQGVLRFASAAARDAAIPLGDRVLGMHVVLDTAPGHTQYWSGTAWEWSPQPFDDEGARRNMYLPSTISIPHNAATKLTSGWTATGSDTGTGLMTYNAGIITLNAEAVLDVSVHIKWAGATGGKRSMELLVNGSAWFGEAGWPSEAGVGLMTATMVGSNYAAGDTFQVQVFQSSGAALNVTGGRWTIRRVARP